jgi:parallel beta-helix repeat protein
MAPVLMGATHYLSPDGDDGDGGTSCDDAWRTLAFALSTSSSLAAGDSLICCADSTGQPGTGRWDDGDEPYQLQPHPSKSGSPGALTTILADTACTVIFDAEDRTGTSQYALYFRNVNETNMRDGYRIQDITFEDYGDENDFGGSATILIQNTALEPAIGYEILDCTFRASEEDSVQGIVWTTLVDPLLDVVEGLVIEGNTLSGAGNHGIRLASCRYPIIRRNTLSRPVAFLDHRPSDSPNAVHYGNNANVGIVIEDNDISGWDHGVLLSGDHHRVAGNRIHDLSDDGIFVQAAAPATLSRFNYITGNVIWNSGDDGIEIRGTGHRVSHNTVFNLNGDVSSWLMAATPCTSCVVSDNIFADSSTNDGLLLLTGSTVALDGNVWWDSDSLAFDDEDGIGETFDFATYQAEGYDVAGVFASPMFSSSDTSSVALYPSPSGRHVGTEGRTAGALPCRPCYWWRLDDAEDGDVVDLEITSPLGSVSRFNDAAIWQWGNGARILDMELTEVGSWDARWTVGASTYLDGATALPTLAETAAAVKDTLQPTEPWSIR